MVCGGLPSSQRNRFGAANQTCPCAVSGFASDFNVRVCTTSADQVWMLACAAIQVERGLSVSAARALKLQVPSAKLQRSTKLQVPKLMARRGCLKFGCWSFIGAWMLGFGPLRREPFHSAREE